MQYQVKMCNNLISTLTSFLIFFVQTKEQLLQAISFTANGKKVSPEIQQTVLDIVRRLETTVPPSSTLLSDPQEAQALDGVWFLQYTSPSTVGEADQFPVRETTVSQRPRRTTFVCY